MNWFMELAPIVRLVIEGIVMGAIFTSVVLIAQKVKEK